MTCAGGLPYTVGTSGEACGVPAVLGGPVRMSVKQNTDRSREYKVQFRVQVDPFTMGPLAALWAAGLPAIGSVFIDFGGAVADNWAYYTAERDVEPDPQEKPGGNQLYLVTCTATNRPGQECTGWGIDYPLAIPDRIRAESVNYQKEAFQDRNGDYLLNSAYEEFRGKEVEYDAHRVRIVIEGNRSTSGLANIESYMNYVNDRTLWGYPARTVKLSHFESEPKYYQNCTKYWINKWTFDVADDFDRCLVDEGTKALIGKWDTNPTSATYGQWILGQKIVSLVPLVYTYRDPTVPSDFQKWQDWKGQQARVVLDGNGRPYVPGTRTGTITGATNATPIVVTCSNHQLTTGTVVTITGVGGNTAANGTWSIVVLTTNTFALYYPVTMDPSTGSGAYTTGGTWSYTPEIGTRCYQVYPQTNLLNLGIPSVIDPSP